MKDKGLKQRIEKAGFVETSVAELLDLSPEEAELLETRLTQARLKSIRTQRAVQND